MKLLGCDPGSTTGLVLVELPPGTWDLLRGRILHTAALAASDDDRRTLERYRAEVKRCLPHVAILEDPADAATYWGQARRGKPVQRGSAYRLGVYKGLLYAALADTVATIVEYRVKGSKADPGWMTDHANRDLVLQRMQALSLQLTGPTLNEHQCMALGVLAHHCSRMQLSRFTAQLATRPATPPPRGQPA